MVVSIGVLPTIDIAAENAVVVVDIIEKVTNMETDLNDMNTNMTQADDEEWLDEMRVSGDDSHDYLNIMLNQVTLFNNYPRPDLI